MAQTVEHAPPGLFEATVKLIVLAYKADDAIFEHTQVFVDRYFPHSDLKDQTLRMIGFVMRSQDLISRLFNPELKKIITRPRTRQESKPYERSLEDDLFGIVGDEEKFEKLFDRPEVEYCNDNLELLIILGFLVWSDLLVEAYLVLASLLSRICREIEEREHVDLVNYLGSFVALQSTKWVSGIFGSKQGKFVEQKTAMMALAASAIYPKEDNADLEPLLRSAMRVAGIRFATFYNPFLNLGGFEEEARREWFTLQNSEVIQSRISWISKALETGGYHRKITLIPEPTYVTGPGLFSGPFPTPFLEIPDELWKRPVLKEDQFPVDVLQGKVTLLPINPDRLFWTIQDKQVPVTGIYSERGGGKTTIMDSLGCFSIDRGYVVFRPTIHRDQALTSILPMMPYDKKDYEYLTEKLRIQPRAYPAKFVTVIENELDLSEGEVYTVNDIIIQVNDLESFSLNWRWLLKGFPKGYLAFRELSDKKVRTSRMRARLLDDFFHYRLRDRSVNLRMQVDEIQEIYGATVGSSEEDQLVKTVREKLTDIRGLNLPFDFGSNRPAALQPDILESVSTFLFGVLRESGAEHARSSRGRMMDAITANMPDSEKVYWPLVEKIMANVSMKEMRLFFMVLDGRFHLVRSMLPPHSLENPDADTKMRFEKFAKEGGHGANLLRSLKDVPRFSGNEFKGPKRASGPRRFVDAPPEGPA